MNYSFFLPCAHSSSVTGILIDEAYKQKKEGNQVDIFYCDGYLKLCKYNNLGQKSKCESCKLKHRYLLKKYFNNENCFSLKEIALEHNVKSLYKNLNYSSVPEIKNLKYENLNIGLGCYSTYVSLTRNTDPLLNDTFRNYFDSLINESIKMAQIVKKIINKDSIICLFNGRFLDSRPIVEYCSNNNINYRCYEAGITKDFKIKKLYYENSLPHNMQAFANKVNKYWEKNENSVDKIQLAHEFFERKLKNKPMGDKVYTADQVENTLPPEWDSKKTNIVIFNSSEDEFAGIGGEYDKHSLFATQYEGIKFIANFLLTYKDIHLYVRIHPNLKNIKYKYHTELLKLDKEFSNLTIIPAGSSVSSYTLLQNSNKVIVFNSTMGVEANYAQKPVILLYAAIYYYLNIAYKPSSIIELEQMLLSKLPPKNLEESLKYAYYYMYVEEKYFETINFSERTTIKILNKKLSFVGYTKLLNSHLVYELFFKLKSYMKIKFSDSKVFNSLPIEEK